jgi:hypothetical protein
VVPEGRSLVMAFSKIYRYRLTLNDEGKVNLFTKLFLISVVAKYSKMACEASYVQK